MGPVTLNPLLNRFSSPKFSNLASISTYLHHLPIPSLPTQSSPWRNFAGLIYPQWVIQGLPVLSNGVIRWWAPRDRRCLGLQLELGPSVEDVSMRNEAISSPIWAPSLSMIIITTPHPFFAIILKLSCSCSASPWTIITIVFILLLLLLFTIIIVFIITFISTIMFLHVLTSYGVTAASTVFCSELTWFKVRRYPPQQGRPLSGQVYWYQARPMLGSECILLHNLPVSSIWRVMVANWRGQVRVTNFGVCDTDTLKTMMKPTIGVLALEYCHRWIHGTTCGWFLIGLTTLGA